MKRLIGLLFMAILTLGTLKAQDFQCSVSIN